jgi:hypothetical protein
MKKINGFPQQIHIPHPALSTRQRLLTRTTLLRKIYRVLLNTGRSYAAFTDKDRALLDSFKSEKEILDPMSGYGSLTKYCSTLGLRTYCVEYNLPQYLWQLLCHPEYSARYVESCRLMLSWKKRWPKVRVRAIASDDWFPTESIKILLDLFQLSQLAIDESFGRQGAERRDLNTAFLLPFVGRFSCSVPGDIVTHVKKGGICVYVGWEQDFGLYLQAVVRSLEQITKAAVCTTHLIYQGDARTFRFPNERFGAMLTSPPYPNHRDFVSMFAPEHAFLDILKMPGGITSRRASEHIIGSNFVSERPSRTPKTQAALRFLKSITLLKRNETAIRHDRQYYLPYFENYFADLEMAYGNIAPSLKQEAEGYIIVVNNTHRNLLVPVADVIVEIWKSLGFNASISTSSEAFHVGTKNPRARGLRARHTEHVVRIWR